MDRDFNLPEYGRSQFEGYILECIVGGNLSYGLAILNEVPGTHSPGINDNVRTRRLQVATITLSTTNRLIDHLATTYKDGSWTSDRAFGLDTQGSPEDTAYSRIDLNTAAESEAFSTEPNLSECL